MKKLKRLVISKEGIFADLEGRIFSAEPVGRPVAFDMLDSATNRYESIYKLVSRYAPEDANAYTAGNSIVIPNEPKSHEVQPVQYYRIRKGNKR